MIIEEKLIAAGVEKLSKILLSLYMSYPNLQKQLVGLDGMLKD